MRIPRKLRIKPTCLLLGLAMVVTVNVNAFVSPHCRPAPWGYDSVRSRSISSNSITSSSSNSSRTPPITTKSYNKRTFQRRFQSSQEETVSGDNNGGSKNETATTLLPPSNENDIQHLEPKQQHEQQQHVVTSWASNLFVGGLESTPELSSSIFGKPKLLGMDVTPELIAITTIYFVEGALGLARLAQTYLLKDELHLGPAELSALTGIFVLPWTIKPIYGFLSDGFPLFGYKRKTYLMAAGLLGGLSYALLGTDAIWNNLPTPTAAITGSVVALLISSACIAMSDVVADGIVVTRTREAANDASVAGGLQSLCWGASAVGGLLSAYFSGSLLQIMSVRNVFALTAVLPLLVAAIALFTEEKPVVAAAANKNDNKEENVLDGIREQVDALRGALQQPSIWRPALFIFLWQSTPTADGAFFFFLTDDLGLGPEFLGRVRLVTAAAGLVGVWIYNQFLKTAKIKDILFWSTIASFPLGMLPVLLITHANRELGIPDTALIYGDDVALAALGQVSFMPTLVLAAKLCPAGVEAVLFATLMSMFNGASTVGTEIGALLTKWFGVTESNFDNLALLTVLCNVTSLYPLLFIGWLDGVGSVAEEDIEKQDSIDAAPEQESTSR